MKDKINELFQRYRLKEELIAQNFDEETEAKRKKLKDNLDVELDAIRPYAKAFGFSPARLYKKFSDYTDPDPEMTDYINSEIIDKATKEQIDIAYNLVSNHPYYKGSL